MVGLNNKFALIVYREGIASVLDTSQQRLRWGSFVAQVIIAEVSRSRRSGVARMSRSSGSRSVIVESTQLGIGSLCAIGAGSSFVSVAFYFPL